MDPYYMLGDIKKYLKIFSRPLGRILVVMWKVHLLTNADHDWLLEQYPSTCKGSWTIDSVLKRFN